MKALITILFCFICLQLIACNKNNKMAVSTNDSLKTDSVRLLITVGTKSFTAILYNNATATAFKSGLPMTINMVELNGNEKYFELPKNLPVNASNPGRIQAGDLMLYGSNTLVLFYKSFSTSYSYTPLGRIEDATELAAALGSGNVTITFAIQN
jgi:hypothetical protein